MLREKLRNRKGFTLIEIIVVIVILAVLMAVAVPSVMSYINEGNKAKYEAVARTVLVNAQTEYAKAVADASGSKDKVQSSDAITTAQTNVNSSSYGDDVTVSDTHITLSGDDTKDAEDRDVKEVTCKIKISETEKAATIKANKKVTIS
jgi:type IV pilus assembly protein PilA